MESPFADRQTDLGDSARRTDDKLCRESRLLVSDIQPLCKALYILFCYKTFYPRKIDLIHMLLWREQPVCEITVIGDDKKPFSIFVKSSHRKEIISLSVFDQIDHGCLIPVFSGRHNTSRFVQHIVFVFFIDDWFTLKCDLVLICIDLYLRPVYCGTVERNSSVPDFFFDLASRAESHIRKVFVESDLHTDCHRHPGRYLFFRT